MKKLAVIKSLIATSLVVPNKISLNCWFFISETVRLLEWDACPGPGPQSRLQAQGQARVASKLYILIKKFLDIFTLLSWDQSEMVFCYKICPAILYWIY
jgi:hypothetical protein